MADISAFRGIHFPSERAGGLALVVAPPYDVISPDEQVRLYAADPHNVVRVILNRSEPGDGAEAPYARAAAHLRAWLGAGILRQDEAPALYIYRQGFVDRADGRTRARTGFFCALRLEPYAAGIVLPHEETRPKAREDRLRLMRETLANVEPIMALFEDADGGVRAAMEAVVAREPLLRVDSAGGTHTVWRMADEAAIGRTVRALADRRVWIADGHHRYETALTFRGEAASLGGGPAAESVLTVLVPFEDPGLLVLPTHRMLRGLSAERLALLRGEAARWFMVERAEDAEVDPSRRPDAAGVIRIGLADSAAGWTLTLRDPTALDDLLPGRPAAWRRLDVVALQTLLLERALGISAEGIATTGDIAFTRDGEEAVRRVRAGEFQVAFLLDLPTARQVRDVAAAGAKMPAKSTYFYPKLLSGLLMRDLRDGPGGAREG
ncbi:MAG: DUF1015 domain-containing protein [Chthonomonadales bacterium]|nr:DUF1015 domain-containing protein [Chthonomonadales bacterium]